MSFFFVSVPLMLNDARYLLPAIMVYLSHIQLIFALFFAICVLENELSSSVYITPKTSDSTLYGMHILMAHLEILILKYECNNCWN